MRTRLGVPHVSGELTVFLDEGDRAEDRRKRLDDRAGASVPDDLTAITRGLVPELQARGVFRRAYDGGTLRDRLGLPRPANRYAGRR